MNLFVNLFKYTKIKQYFMHYHEEYKIIPAICKFPRLLPSFFHTAGLISSSGTR